jgi:hypothetical protein
MTAITGIIKKNQDSAHPTTGRDNADETGSRCQLDDAPLLFFDSHHIINYMIAGSQYCQPENFKGDSQQKIPDIAPLQCFPNLLHLSELGQNEQDAE